jgi:hypothetical protein
LDGSAAEVKRYSLTYGERIGDLYMERAAHGEWVKFTDYDSREGDLLARVAEMERALERIERGRDLASGLMLKRDHLRAIARATLSKGAQT